MRLHAMEMTAFGPFGGTERVDLDALCAAGLFLLHGPTGAGKTTVLDAVCFALFGTVPGARGQAGRLRSDYAQPDRATRVVLELTVRERRLRVTRSPQWERPKRRGSGTTTEPARTLVEELTGSGWTALSTRNDEAAQLLRGLLGLSAEQFCQVVLLPQGQFARFLRADAEARRPLLEQLFDTRRFSAVEAWLAERRRSTARALEQAEEAVREVQAAVREAARPLLTCPTDREPPLADLLERATAAEAAARGEHIRAGDAFSAARATAERARDLAAAQRRWAELNERAERARAAEPRQAELAATLSQAHRALGVLPAAASAERARAGAAAARAAAAAARDHVHRMDLAPVAGLDAQAADPAALGAAAQVLRAELARARALEDEATRLHLLAGEAADLHDRAAVVSGRLRSVTERIALAESDRPRRHAELTAARDAGADLAAATVEAAACADRVTAARRRDALAGRLTAAEAELTAAVERAQQAREDLLDLRQARLEGFATELARALAAGDSCPVCGSVEHPNPASTRGRTSGPPVGEAAERAAEARYATEQTAREAAEGAVSVLRAELATAAAQAGGAAPVAALVDELARAESRVAAAEQASGQAATLEAALQEADDRLTADRDLLLALHTEQAELDARASSAAAGRDQLADRLALACGADQSLAARTLRLHAAVEALDRCAAAVGEQARAEAEQERAEHALHEASSQAGFATPDAALAAALTAEQTAALQRESAALTAEAAAVAELLADPGLRAAAHTAPADPDGALGECNAAQARLEAAAADLAAAADTARALHRLGRDLAEAAGRRDPLAEEHALVDGLSRLAEGTGADNSKRMRLSAYVLAARLEQVAVAASERLARMSGQRYTLVHTDEGAGRGRAGLGLRVVDAWTGQERDTATLSGGESFFASLALALGLADVVAAEAGGIRLETLFVDEGFGSLDEDTLDEVMDVLDGLRTGGRAVGVVSHVADLRRRIPAQLCVRKRPTGSTVEVVGG